MKNRLSHALSAWLVMLTTLSAQAALKEGDLAPLFKLQASQAGKPFAYALSDALKKGPVVVYFYPSAYTNGCNIQAHTFAVHADQFAQAGASIVGVSLDSIQRLNDFSADPDFCAGKITVASDADGSVARSFDLPIVEIPAGRKDTRGIDIDHARTDRTTFIVTPDTKIVAVVGGVAPQANVEAALQIVQNLKTKSNPKATWVTPAITGVVAEGTPIELIKEGFKGTEGPVTLPDGSLIFTETQDNRITRIAPDGSTSSFVEGSNGANGLGFTANGDLYAVQVLKTRVGIVFPPPKVRTLADNFEGAPFGRPNDLVVDQKGNVYFTDSGANPTPAGQAVAPTQAVAPARPAVYRISNTGDLKRLAADIERPNGIQLSPDDKVLYVANTLGEHLLAYDIRPDGSVSERRQFAKLAGWSKTETGFSSGADGIAVDDVGRVYVATNAGIEVFSSHGAALGSIALPKKPQNLAFAGKDKKTLYVVGRGAAYRFPVITAGVSTRAK
jgi:sugar lactone lactonase YvrE/peroxiredoxin